MRWPIFPNIPGLLGGGMIMPKAHQNRSRRLMPKMDGRRFDKNGAREMERRRRQRLDYGDHYERCLARVQP